MNKRDFFIAAMNAGRMTDKRWTFAAFSVMLPKPDSFGDMKPYDIIYTDLYEGSKGDVKVVFIDGEGNIIDLTDYEYKPNDPQPPYSFKDSLTLLGSEMENLEKSKIETTYGNVLTNWLLIVHPMGGKIPYIEGRYSVRDVENKIEHRLTDEPKDGGARNDKNIYVDEYFKFRRSASLIDGFTQLCVPSATAKSMTRHPDTEKVRDALFEKYKDQLNDPTIIIRIEDELKALDAAHLKGDAAEGFYIKQKYLDVIRKKTFLTGGLVESFGEEGGGTLVKGALTEGWDIETLPALVNDLREGSFDRGASTALGGEAVKFILRVMQNTIIEEDDCKTKLGIEVTITKATKIQYVLNWVIDGTKLIQLTEENIASYYNKPIKMRTPLFCKTSRSSFCSTCIGGRYGEHKESLATAASNVGSIFLSTFLASMHGKSLSTAKYNYKKALT